MHHLDSAIWYFEREQEVSGIYGKLDAHNNLTRLEDSRHNTNKALIHYKLLVNIMDSVQKMSQSENTRRVNAQYNLNQIKEERDEIARHSNHMETVLYIFLAVTLLGILLVYYIWKFYQQKQRSELSHEKLLRQIEEEKYKHSVSQIEENKRKIDKLKKQLIEAKQQNDPIIENQLRLDSEQLIAENQSLEAKQRRHQFLLEEFQKSTLYSRLIINAGKEKFHFTDEEWQQLGENIDKVGSTGFSVS